MSELTKAQEWNVRLTADCTVISRTEPYSQMFDHVHDLADCAFARAEEVATEVAALTNKQKVDCEDLFSALKIIGDEIGSMQKRLTALESARAAQDDWHKTVVTETLTRLENEIDDLESARVTPAEARETVHLLDQLCVCGHRNGAHFDNDDSCSECSCQGFCPSEARESEPVCATCGHAEHVHGLGVCGGSENCPCTSFRPAAPPAPSELDVDLCSRCGHVEHVHGLGACGGSEDCDCTRFRPAAPTAPEPAPTVALDPVLVKICEAWKAWKRQDGGRDAVVGIYLEDAYRSQAGITERYDLEREMLFYGAGR